MSRIKAVKVEPIRSQNEFEATVDEVAKMAIHREKLEVALKKRHQDLDEKYGEEIKSLSKNIEELRVRAEDYFEDHAGELCEAGRRGGSTKLANFGVRLGNPTVTKAGRFKKVAWKALGIIFDGIDRLKAFVRDQPEVNKDAILAVFRDLKSTDPEIRQVAEMQKKVLDEYEISMEQNDEFWIEPKADKQVETE